MRNQNFLFICFCLILLTGLMQSYALFQNHFSPHKDDQKMISELKNSLEKEKLQRILTQNQLSDYQQQVAAQLPEFEEINKGSESYQLRNLASVSQAPIDGFDLSKTLSERAKAEFRDGKLDQAVKSFSLMIKKYPTSPLVPESYFFMGEAYFMMQNPQDCLDVVDKMMNHFPEHELTGFLMLRMGQILQSQGRSDEAREVFSLVSQKFAYNHELKDQARKLELSAE